MKYLKLLSVVLLSFVGCDDDQKEEIPVFEIGLEQPINFPAPTYDINDNPIDAAGFELGRKLFYDVKLSDGNTISCAECHNQAFAFTHHGHDLSEGVLVDQLGVRNSQPIQNLAFMNAFTWDGSVELLWRQPVVPITEKVEMNETLENVINKLKQDANYPTKFETAFGGEDAVNPVNMLKALAQFMGAMVSSNSKYDKYVRGEVGGDFSDEEKEGMRLFENKCASCHSGELFTNQEFVNNGIGVNSKLPNELGRARISASNPDLTIEEGKAHPDYYKFKVPSLRNVEKTFPYMHDGRIVLLKQVLDFYDTDTYPYIQKMDNLDVRLIQTIDEKEVLGIPMTEEEKESIILFLETLTDDEFLNDTRFAKP
ncbi:cytochrome c peroxidase [Flavicella sp.]|uniref:cytochrome-c peroxidase n=1 Tax=Flavicella sp. TaxID=2957742 RepID=UPI00261DAE02|nr:cytochrome c peroxidase [Flavicella sp.]MDG1805948.1 cytochrome c peroxidase [Flavicella sp.]